MIYTHEDDLVSVIVPIYNCEKYLEECIESLMNQTYKNIEIILVDDGSTDSSGIICDIYAKKDSRIEVIHQKNSGVSVARNNGINVSRGDYLTFVDSDDYVDESYCQYLHYLCVDKKTNISLTPQPKKFSNKEQNFKLENDNDKAETWTGEQAAINMLYYKIVISSWNKMFYSKMIKKNRIYFDTGLAYGEGFAFVIDAFLHSNGVACGHKTVYNYRVDNANSVMTNFKERLVCGSVEALNKIKTMLYGERMLNAWEYANWHTYCDCFNTIVGCQVKNSQQDLYSKTKDICKKKALIAIIAPVSFKEKMKAVMYFISPQKAAYVINKARKRTFTKVASI